MVVHLHITSWLPHLVLLAVKKGGLNWMYELVRVGGKTNIIYFNNKICINITLPLFDLQRK